MRAFACGRCSLLLTFESTECLGCGAPLAFDWPTRELRTFSDPPPPRCANAGIAACNWLPEADGELCASCVTTRTRPADSDASGLAGFARAEAAKRRLLFELAELGLPIPRRPPGTTRASRSICFRAPSSPSRPATPTG